ncbi:U3 small nucleolar RNA-associated protein 25, partial [Ananas comosus]
FTSNQITPKRKSYFFAGLNMHKTKLIKEPMKESRRTVFPDDKWATGASSSSSSGLSAEEYIDSAVPEDYDVGDLSVFDSLLKALASDKKKLKALDRKRQREQEGRKVEAGGQRTLKSAKLYEEEDVSKEGSSESSLADNAGDDLQRDQVADALDLSEDDDTENEDEASDGDESEKQDGLQDIANGKESSSFYRHLGRILTKEEANELMKQKWTFKWELPAGDMQMSKWVGTGEPISKEHGSNIACELKDKLYNHWQNIYKTSRSNDFNSSRESFFFSLCKQHLSRHYALQQEAILSQRKQRGFKYYGRIYYACCMTRSFLNHVYRTRNLVLKNDAKISKHGELKEEEILCDDCYLDQGFTRPKVVILLPLASIALRVVKRLIQLTPLSSKANVGHLNCFTEEFGAEDVEDADDENENSKSKKHPKPADFTALFNGNNNDHFVLGIKFTKRTIKLYSDFYSSDIIVASPLGLITKIGETEFDKEKDVDYLSSIEVVIVDHVDVISMQNWVHVNTVFEHLNRTPLKQHGTDMMRIRPWYLDEHARFYRQTILLGSYLNPDMNALFNRLCINYEGKVKLATEFKGVLPKILLQIRQVYKRFEVSSIIDADDARLDYFCKKVFPKIRDSIEGGVLLFISSYFEFVRIRNFLKSQNASFCLLGEYTKQSDISRARIWFFEGKRKIMLYTERAHFYHRYKIRGIKNLIIYSLPERKEFYHEIINALDGTNIMCSVLFSRFDQLKLERIVGTSSAKRMLSSDKDMFVFC